MSVLVLGDGPIADRLRNTVSSDVEAVVVVTEVDGGRGVGPVEDLDDATIDAVFEQPMRKVIAGLQRAHAAGAKRIVVIVPTIGMSGGDQHAVHAALAEAARITVKSAARQWGAEGITVNAVALAPERFGVDPAVSGPVAIAPRAMSGEVGGNHLQASPHTLRPAETQHVKHPAQHLPKTHWPEQHGVT